MTYDYLMPIFLAEAEKNLAELDASWEVLSSQPADAACRERLYRAVHSLTGNASMMGLSQLADCSGAVENVARGWQERAGAVDQATIERLREDIDRLRGHVMQIATASRDTLPDQRDPSHRFTPA